MIFVLFAFLILILFINLKEYKFDYIAPAVVFTFSFVFSVFVCCLYYKKWEVSLNFVTFFIILLGTLLFSITCLIIYKKEQNTKIDKLAKLNYNKIFSIIFIFFGIMTIALTIKFILEIVGTDIAHFRNALYTYRNRLAFKKENIGLPFYLNMFTGITHAAGFWFIYVMLNNYITTKKIDIILLINIVICLLTTFLEGYRSMGVNYILFTICCYIYLENINNNFEKKIGFKGMLKILLLGIIILSLFKFSAVMVGRDDTNNISNIDYIALYVGAEIKNFDTFICENINNSQFDYQYGKYTFSSLSNMIAQFFGHDIDRNFPFRYINGYSLGNVYTIFYHFYMDFGFIGTIIFPIIMAIIAQCLYNRSRNFNNNSRVYMYGIIYCYSFSGIFYSFFSNHFFDLIFSSGFVKYLILWYFFNYLFLKQNRV